jgi:gliding motility-associated-like protein
VPQVNFDWDSIYMCNRSEIYLEAGPVDSTMTYTWQDNSSLPYYTVTQPGTYWVVAGRSDCYASDTVWVGACTEFWVPNAFTPNKDGVNDIFYVFPSDVEKITRFSIYIYNRWGEQVYYSDNILMGWDGTFKGKDCPQATYSYVIIFEAAGNVPLEKEGTSRGHVTLYR